MKLIEPAGTDAHRVALIYNALQALARGDREINALRSQLEEQSSYSVSMTFNQ